MKNHHLLLLLATLTLLASGSSEAAPDVPDLYRQTYRLETEGNAAQALSVMDEIRARSGPSYFVHVRTAWLAYLAGRFTLADSEYEKAAAAAPDAVEPLLGKTLALLAQ